MCAADNGKRASEHTNYFATSNYLGSATIFPLRATSIAYAPALTQNERVSSRSPKRTYPRDDCNVCSTANEHSSQQYKSDVEKTVFLVLAYTLTHHCMYMCARGVALVLKTIFLVLVLCESSKASLPCERDVVANNYETGDVTEKECQRKRHVTKHDYGVICRYRMADQATGVSMKRRRIIKWKQTVTARQVAIRRLHDGCM
jgi:hypothetical protein